MTVAKEIFHLIRKPWGQGFTYKYIIDDTTLTDSRLKEWIKSLAIPPAWAEVKITTNKKAKVLAIGRDAKNKKQYIYNPKFVEENELRKYSRMIDFGKALPKMRSITTEHMKAKRLSKKKVLACMVQLLDNAYFRAGSLRYAKNNNTYGLTTLRSKHISINNNTAEFDYVGKSGKKQHKEVSDSTLSRTLNDLEDIPGYELFKFRDKDNKTHKIDRNMLNQYIKEVMGESFTAKDFRTWAGTYLAATLLDELGIAKSQKIAKSNISQAIDKVASILGNTPNITKSSYIDPKVITSYSEGITLSQYIQEVQREIESEDLFNKNERAVFSLLSDID